MKVLYIDKANGLEQIAAHGIAVVFRLCPQWLYALSSMRPFLKNDGNDGKITKCNKSMIDGTRADI